jgi:hypothetical protein
MSDRDALAGKIDDAFTPYGVLGVPYNATDREIRAAYIKLAKEFHPDNWPDDPATEIRFKRITEAYNTIRDRHSYSGSRQNQRASGAGFFDARVFALAAFFFLVTPGIILFLTRSQNIDPQSHGEDQAASVSNEARRESPEPAPAINTPGDGGATQQASGLAPGQGQQEAARLEGGEQKLSAQQTGGADMKDIPERAIAAGAVKIAPAEITPPEVISAANSRSESIQPPADLPSEGLNRAPEGGAASPGHDDSGTKIASAQPRTASGPAPLNQKIQDRHLSPKSRPVTGSSSNSGKVALNGSGRTPAAAGAANARMNDILAGGL